MVSFVVSSGRREEARQPARRFRDRGPGRPAAPCRDSATWYQFRRRDQKVCFSAGPRSSRMELRHL